jgi:hypothetical protein
MLAEESSSAYIPPTAERRKVKEDRCNKLAWLTFNQNTRRASSEVVCTSSPIIAGQNSQIVKGFVGSFWRHSRSTVSYSSNKEIHESE